MLVKSKKFNAGLIYLAELISLTLVRILFTGINYSDNFSDLLFTFLSQIICMGALPYAMHIALNGKGSFKERNLEMKKNLQYVKSDNRDVLKITIIIAICFIFITRLVSILNSAILSLIGFVQISGASVIYGGAGDLIIDLMFTAALPAIFEEFTHRGVLLNNLREECGDIYAIVMSAFMFALMHQNIQQFLYTFVGGLILGYLTVYTKSIFPAMFVHFLNNAWSVLTSYSYQTNGFISLIENLFYAYSEIFGYALMILLYGLSMYLTYRYLKKLRIRYKINNPFSYKVRYDKEINLALSSSVYSALLLGSLCTIFTLVWGILR